MQYTTFQGQSKSQLLLVNDVSVSLGIVFQLFFTFTPFSFIFPFSAADFHEKEYVLW